METEENDCDTIIKIPCQQYFTDKFSDLEKRLEQRDALHKEALDKAENTLALRLHNLNESKELLLKQSAQFVTRNELNTMLETVKKDIAWLMRIVSIGIGGVAVLQILLKYVIK